VHTSKCGPRTGLETNAAQSVKLSPRSHDLVTRHTTSWVATTADPSDLSLRYRFSNGGTLVAISQFVLVDAVFQYRTLIGKSDLGCGLNWDEIDRIGDFEARFAPDENHNHTTRKFRREETSIEALIRGNRINDRVEIIELGPGGLICRNAPYIAAGEQIEVFVDAGDLSYRFRAIGKWLRDDGDDYKVGLAFVGMPVCLHKAQVSTHQLDLIDQIAAAA